MDEETHYRFERVEELIGMLREQMEDILKNLNDISYTVDTIDVKVTPEEFPEPPEPPMPKHLTGF